MMEPTPKNLEKAREIGHYCDYCVALALDAAEEPFWQKLASIDKAIGYEGPIETIEERIEDLRRAAMLEGARLMQEAALACCGSESPEAEAIRALKPEEVVLRRPPP